MGIDARHGATATTSSFVEAAAHVTTASTADVAAADTCITAADVDSLRAARGEHRWGDESEESNWKELHDRKRRMGWVYGFTG